MYRATMNRVLQVHQQLWRGNANLRISLLSISTITNNTSTLPNSQSFVNQIPNDQSIPSQIPIYTDDSTSSDGVKRPQFGFQDEQARVLQASLQHVIRLGWTESAMSAGAREVGLSPSIVGSFTRKEAALVEFFMDDCLQKIIDVIDSEEAYKNILPSKCISKLVRMRLEMQAPYLSKWPQALSIQAQPLNVPTSFKQLAMLIDEIWHAVGDEASDLDWYVKRTILGGIYSTTEASTDDNVVRITSSPIAHDGRKVEALKIEGNGAAVAVAQEVDVYTYRGFVNPKWVNGTWDLNQFQKDGATDWDAVIDAEVRMKTEMV